MATTQKTTGTRGRKPAAKSANPNIAGETLKKLEKGQVPQTAPETPELPPEAPRSEEAKHDKRFLAVSEGSCLTALQRAFGFGKAAIHLECAVALTVFAFSDHGANREASNHMKEIYQQAGYDCGTEGDDYKTIMRRIGAFAKLYNSMDRREIIGAMDGRTEMDAIEALKNYLAMEYNFNGINAILAAAGSPVKQTNTPEYRENRNAQQTEGSGKGGNSKDDPNAELTPEGQRVNQDGSIDKRTAPEGGKSQATLEAQGASPEDQATAAKLGERMQNRRAGDQQEDRRDRRATDNRQAFLRRASDQPNAIVFHTDHIHIAIPRGITRDEVTEMALKLMNFAATMNFDAESNKQAIEMQGNGKQLAHAGGDRRQHH